MTRRILLVNVTLGGRTGTEIVTRDLAAGLAARGHHVTVYSPALGPIADELRRAGVRVCARIADVETAPEIVHGHHHVETVQALLQFPEARGIFVCHDRTAAHSIPPMLGQVGCYVAVDQNCLERLTADWQIPPGRTRLIPNAVDLSRFRPRPPLPPVARRALVFSHNAAPGSYLEIVRAVCADAGLAVDVAGAGSGAETASPESMLGQYDLVFAKARCALEALAVGCAVVLCDVGGLGGIVTSANVGDLRGWNFGARTLRPPLDPALLLREIRRYDAEDAARVSQVIRNDSSLDQALDRYEALYEELFSHATPALSRADELRALLGPLTNRLASLESRLSELHEPERMNPLGDADVARIHVALEHPPGELVAGEAAFVQMRLRSDVPNPTLGSWPPYPVQWGYRWRRVDSPDFIVAECERTRIRQPVRPGAEERCAVQVIAPAAPGRYVLRITLIQEWVLWLDQAATPVCCDVEVLVTSPGR